MEYKKLIQKDKERCAQIFKYMLGYDLNLDDPQTFNEKIQWLKFNYKNPLMTICADKYKVRDYLEKKGVSKYLIPLLDVGDKFEDLNWDNLPKKFVVKANHDCGSVWIVKNKGKENKKLLREKVNNALSKKFGGATYEMHYQDIPPKVIVEKFLELATGYQNEYKIFCFNGEPKYITAYSVEPLKSKSKPTDIRSQIIHNLSKGMHVSQTIYSTNWENLKFSTAFPSANKEIKKPKKLKKMLEIAKIISRDFPHVRVDYYYMNDEIYLGELTFTHLAGFFPFSEFKWDKKLGEALKLPIKN